MSFFERIFRRSTTSPLKPQPLHHQPFYDEENDRSSSDYDSDDSIENHHTIPSSVIPVQTSKRQSASYTSSEEDENLYHAHRSRSNSTNSNSRGNRISSSVSPRASTVMGAAATTLAAANAASQHLQTHSNNAHPTTARSSKLFGLPFNTSSTSNDQHISSTSPARSDKLFPLPFSQEKPDIKQQQQQERRQPQYQHQKGLFTCPICLIELRTDNNDIISQHVDTCLNSSFGDRLRLASAHNQQNNQNNPFTNNATQTTTTTTTTTSSSSSSTNSPVVIRNNNNNNTNNTTIKNNNNNNSTSSSVSSSPKTTTKSSPSASHSTSSSSSAVFSSSRLWQDSVDSPFTVYCPYPACTRKMEAFEFYFHAIREHATSESQSFSCPICALEGSTYTPGRGTNLLRHLQSYHPEFSTIDPSTFTSSQTTNQPTTSHHHDNHASDDDLETGEDGTITIPKVQELGSRYVFDILPDSYIGQECLICYEEFEDGIQIARMDCFCIFHKDCIERWLMKSRKCPLHKD